MPARRIGGPCCLANGWPRGFMACQHIRFGIHGKNLWLVSTGRAYCFHLGFSFLLSKACRCIAGKLPVIYLFLDAPFRGVY